MYLEINFYTGRAWAAVSTEGLLIYSLDDVVLFDPFDLTIDLTPSTVNQALINKEYLAAIVYSFRLNDYDLVSRAMETVPIGDSKWVWVVSGWTIRYKYK